MESIEIKRYSLLLKLMNEFGKIDPEMPRQMMACFIEIAKDEGVTMKELTDRLGISQASCSRNVAALSATHRTRKPGHNLVIATEDPMERRRKIVKLTSKGKALARSILELLEPCYP